MAKNFTFNGTTSTSKKLKCKDINHLSFASKSYESIKIPGRTGNLIIDDGSFENKVIEITALLDLRGKTNLEKKTAINGLKTWLIKPVGYKTLLFDDTIQYQAICQGVDIGEAFNDYLELKISFEVVEVFS